jgi:heme-degrading monooxygenase HmoA
MVVRSWKGRARPESADAYQRHVVTSVFPALKKLPGFLGARVLRRALGDRVEFLVLTEWESLDAIRGFAGDPIDRAVVEPAAQAVLSDFDDRVEHYDVAERV